MIRDNFQPIREFLSFPELGDFYLIQVLQRRKDNPCLKGDRVVIDNVLVYSFDMFDSYRERIVSKCEANNARAYIRINRRNDRKLAQYTLNAISSMVANNQHPKMVEILNAVQPTEVMDFDLINDNQKEFIKRLVISASELVLEAVNLDQSTLRKEFMSASGKYSSDGDKKWIIDLDKEILEHENFFISLINVLHKEIVGKESKIYIVLNTVSGKHIICSPFNVSKFTTAVNSIGIKNENLLQKDSPTLLYY